MESICYLAYTEKILQHLKLDLLLQVHVKGVQTVFLLLFSSFKKKSSEELHSNSNKQLRETYKNRITKTVRVCNRYHRDTTVSTPDKEVLVEHSEYSLSTHSTFSVNPDEKQRERTSEEMCFLFALGSCVFSIYSDRKPFEAFPPRYSLKVCVTVFYLVKYQKC